MSKKRNIEVHPKTQTGKTLRSKKTVRRIGIDLDGVIIGFPPLVPKKLLELLTRTQEKNSQENAYRYPDTNLERWVRILSHHPLFRPPIEPNRTDLLHLADQKKYIIFAVSGRYGFLKNRTEEWLRKKGMLHVFTGVFINEANEQPHHFKQRMIGKLDLHLYLDDDPFVVTYLRRTAFHKSIVLVTPKTRLPDLIGLHRTR